MDKIQVTDTAANVLYIDKIQVTDAKIQFTDASAKLLFIDKIQITDASANVLYNFGLSLHLLPFFAYTCSEGSGESAQFRMRQAPKSHVLNYSFHDHYTYILI